MAYRFVVAATLESNTQAMALRLQTFVERHPARLGGVPVFRGTRVPVKSLFDHLGAGDSAAVFLDDFPGVTEEQVRAVLDAAAAQLLENVK